MSHRTDLEDHDAHGVRDDVVELAGDASPLFGHGHSGCALSLALCPRCPLLGGLGLLRPFVQREPDQPTDREEHGDEEQVADRVGRVVVDDCGRTGHDDDQSGACLPLLTQVAQQHCGDHTGDGDRGLPDDQATVDEGQGSRIDRHRRRTRHVRRNPTTPAQRLLRGDFRKVQASQSTHAMVALRAAITSPTGCSEIHHGETP